MTRTMTKIFIWPQIWQVSWFDHDYEMSQVIDKPAMLQTQYKVINISIISNQLAQQVV